MEQENICECSNSQIIKKGFNGTHSVIGLVVGIAVSLFIIYRYFSNDTIDMAPDPLAQPENQFTKSAALILAGLAPTLGAFAGTIDMNNIIKVCPDCHKTSKIEIKSESIFN